MVFRYSNKLPHLLSRQLKIMTSIIALLAIAIFSFPALEAYPTPGPSTDLSAVEKEIIMIRQDVLPGIKVSAKLLVSSHYSQGLM